MIKLGYEIEQYRSNKTILRLYGDGIEQANIISRFGDKVDGVTLVYKTPVKYFDVFSGNEHLVYGGELDSVELCGSFGVLENIIKELSSENE